MSLSASDFDKEKPDKRHFLTQRHKDTKKNPQIKDSGFVLKQRNCISVAPLRRRVKQCLSCALVSSCRAAAEAEEDV
ncbi:MAG: hypothetical protein V4507_16780 [Verrucomicrobiota bacterium]